MSTNPQLWTRCSSLTGIMAGGLCSGQIDQIPDGALNKNKCYDHWLKMKTKQQKKKTIHHTAITL